MAAGLSAALALLLPVVAAPGTQTDAPEVVSHSIFVIPTNPQEGRDPFFPNSSRPYESAPAAQKNRRLT